MVNKKILLQTLKYCNCFFEQCAARINYSEKYLRYRQ